MPTYVVPAAELRILRNETQRANLDIVARLYADDDVIAEREKVVVTDGKAVHRSPVVNIGGA
jgi:hypothetical protein